MMSFDLGRLGRLIRKELSESLRDRRTVTTLILMPLLLYPVLAMAFQTLLLSQKLQSERPTYRLGFIDEQQAKDVSGLWNQGIEGRFARHADPAEKDLAPAYLKPIPGLQYLSVSAEKAEEALKADKIHVFVRLKELLIPKKAGDDFRVDLELSYREGSYPGKEAVKYLDQLTSDANAFIAGSRFRQHRLPYRGDAVRVRALEVPDSEAAKNPLLPVLVPLILILMTMTGAVYPAIDLTAGERERGTLEILIAAPIPRMSVLFAKYVAVVTVAMLTALMNLGSMSVTLWATGIGATLFGASWSLAVLLQVFALLLLFSLFFSGVLLALTSFARTFKEAQAYLIPLMLLCLTPGMLALVPGLKLEGPLCVVPLINIVLLTRDLFEGVASLPIALIVIVITLVYALAAVSLAARLFGTEAVLASEQGGWGDLFRRPAEVQPRADASTALLCLALMFPVMFLINSTLGQLAGQDLLTLLLLAALGQFFLFAGFPLIAAQRGNVSLISGFALRLPSWRFWFLGAMLGVSLWPFVHEVILLLKTLGISTLSEAISEKVRETIVKWREYPPWLLLGVMAILPAILEEFFFRGYLQRALSDAKTPWRGIVTSAALFAVFHLFVKDSLAIERLLPSFLLGVVLGRLAYLSGSIYPGMVLHAIHNGTLILLGYYEPNLQAGGWLPEGSEHVPMWLLGTAGAFAFAGLAWLLRETSARQ